MFLGPQLWLRTLQAVQSLSHTSFSELQQPGHQHPFPHHCQQDFTPSGFLPSILQAGHLPATITANTQIRAKEFRLRMGKKKKKLTAALAWAEAGEGRHSPPTARSELPSQNTSKRIPGPRAGVQAGAPARLSSRIIDKACTGWPL